MPKRRAATRCRSALKKRSSRRGRNRSRSPRATSTWSSAGLQACQHRMMTTTRRIALAAALFGAAVTPLAAQRGRGGAPPTASGPRTGTLEHVTVNGRAADVYLPPSYASDAARRFPVVYLLAERPADNLKLPEAADRLSSAPGFSEPIVVFPDASGSLADLEKFVGEDLVGFVDGKYRTLAVRISRGLAGYAVGGDGALRVGISRPSVFSSL